MCHYTHALCAQCYQTIYRSPINCGYGVAILGPSGLTIECLVFDVNAVMDESKTCANCVNVGSGEENGCWEKWILWWRERGGEYDFEQ
jgi:hypothetical protein